MQIINNDALRALKTLPDECCRTCITSPPYFRLRDYGVEGQIGLEDSLDEYITKLVEVFREVKRVLTKDGTLWLNIADSYAGTSKGRGSDGVYGKKQRQTKFRATKRNFTSIAHICGYKVQGLVRCAMDACIRFKKRRMVSEKRYHLAKA